MKKIRFLLDKDFLVEGLRSFLMLHNPFGVGDYGLPYPR